MRSSKPSADADLPLLLKHGSSSFFSVRRTFQASNDRRGGERERRRLTIARVFFRRVTRSASFVALGMAEIVSAIPSAGGPYYWSAIIAPRRSSAFWSWVTGWANFGPCPCT
jgi:hypothetical protein